MAPSLPGDGLHINYFSVTRGIKISKNGFPTIAALFIKLPGGFIQGPRRCLHVNTRPLKRGDCLFSFIKNASAQPAPARLVGHRDPVKVVAGDRTGNGSETAVPAGGVPRFREDE